MPMLRPVRQRGDNTVGPDGVGPRSIRPCFVRRARRLLSKSRIRGTTHPNHAEATERDIRGLGTAGRVCWLLDHDTGTD